MLHVSGEDDNGRNKHQRKKQPRGSCELEVVADEKRFGRISSDDLDLGGGGSGKKGSVRCSITFKGNPGDVLLLHLDSFRLK